MLMMVRGLESSLVVDERYARLRALGSRLVVVGLLVLLSGCPNTKQANTESTKKDVASTPRASVALRVLVVNEPGVAEAINRLRGEWAERSGGELSATSGEWNDVAIGKSIDADVVISPSRYLGELCTRGWLQPVRSSVLQGTEFNAGDVFPVVRRELMRWGGEVMALPLGVRIAMRNKSTDDHPGIALLAEAAPTALSNGHEGVLFDPQTMKPRIDDAPFIKALQRLVEIGPANGGTGIGFAQSAPVLGFDDRLVAVSTASRNGASAFKLIAWFASAEISTQLARAGKQQMPVRRSLMMSSAWYEAGLNASERAKLAEALATSLSGEKCLLLPRIPGVDEYMAAIDGAVKSAIFDKVPANVALQRAADRWNQITDALGRDKQRQAYLKHLGIAE
jgi:hypothetical protein